MSAFAGVVEEGGFAAAGRRLGLSRAQVSKHVMALEDALGAQLLNRTTRKVSPTPAGRAFYDKAAAVLADLAAAERSVQDAVDEPQGDLRVNAPMSFGTMHLAPAIADFMRAYPKLTVSMALTDRQVDPVAEGFDVTVRIGAPVETSALIDHQIGGIRRVVCASPDYLSANGRPTTPSDLAGHDCLYYGASPGQAIWRLTKDDVAYETRIRARMTADNGEALLAAAVAGLGLALLPTFIVGADLQAGRLVTVLDDYAPPPIELCLIYPPNRHLSPRLRAFVAFMYDRFGERPYWDLVD
ncbi:MAG: LysR family transcriptional regulator [Pseudomonadota bacterium]